MEFVCKIKDMHILSQMLFMKGYKLTTLIPRKVVENNDYSFTIDTTTKKMSWNPTYDGPMLNDPRVICDICSLGDWDEFKKKFEENPFAVLAQATSAMFNSFDDEDEEKENSNDLSKYLAPGYIVKFTKHDTVYLGVVICDNNVMYMTTDGYVKGYVGNFTDCAPFVVEAIYKPSSEHFVVHELDKMEIVYQKSTKKEPVKVNKSISDIEKELGLEPGTLNIV